MAVVKELIRTEENQSISFGNYELPQNPRYQISHIRRYVQGKNIQRDHQTREKWHVCI